MDKATTDLNIPLGAPNWMDLMTDDVDRAVDFYQQLFGWQVQDTPEEFGGYKYFTKDGQAVGGCMLNQPEWDMPSVWSIYLHTADADRTSELATENGGEVLMPTMKVFDNGSFTVLRDSGGAVISAWQPDKERGFGLLHTTGAAGHFELHTREYDKAVEFYRQVFAWDPQTLADEQDFRYTGFGPYEAPVAGIMDASAFLPEGIPAHWSVYISVDDADKTVEQARNMGAKVIMEPESTPYGRLATVQDPTGAIFKLQA